MGRSQPPRLARRLLERALPADIRDAITGDLAEVFSRDRRADGAERAHLRYWRKALSLSAHFTFERLRERRLPLISATDLKLGYRLLVRYPGLSLLSSLTMAFAIAVGAAAFEFLNQVISPVLPLHDGRRIVGIRLWHTGTNGVEEQALWDYMFWRGQLETIEDLGVFRTVERNVIGGTSAGAPTMAAEITASGFAVARVPALLGRTLDRGDEEPGAAPVVVIGYDVWQSQFEGDAGVVGRTVQVGDMPRTIVGVMPGGFGFPRMHSLWMPLRVSDLEFDRRQGPWVYVFGRLAPGVSIEEAQAELTAFGQRASTAHPDTHALIRPEVLPFAQVVSPGYELAPATLRAINLFFVLLVVLVCANVALLTFARAASRRGELLVRTALGATRRRIAGQLFAEALALGTVALTIGLWAAGFVLRWWLRVARAEDHGRLPFWYSDTLGASTVVYAGLLMILGALIAGVVPALKATGRSLESRLRQVSPGGGGLRFGGVWTAVIVAQVALTVAFPASAFFIRQTVVQIRSVDPGFPADRYVSGRLEMDPEFARGNDGVVRARFPEERFRRAADELARRLSADPDVAAVTFADRVPGTYHPPRRVQLEGDQGSTARAGVAHVGLDYFDVLAAPIHLGRNFTTSDLKPQARTAIVNASFARDVLGGRNAIGLRFREQRDGANDHEAAPWLEIVGVVGDLGVIAGSPTETAGYYRPSAVEALDETHLLLHVRGEVTRMSSRLRALASEVEPALRLYSVGPVSDGDPTMWLEFDFLFKLFAVVSAVALLLSLASVYAVMSFAVSQRSREIGIRVALGADAIRVGAATFTLPLTQLTAGVILGAGLTAALAVAVTGEYSARGAGIVFAHAIAMLSVCLLSSIAPIRQALRVDPTEALRADS